MKLNTKVVTGAVKLNYVNIKEPKRTNVIVLIPISPQSFLSFPNIQPITKRIPILIRNSIFA